MASVQDTKGCSTGKAMSDFMIRDPMLLDHEDLRNAWCFFYVPGAHVHLISQITNFFVEKD